MASKPGSPSCQPSPFHRNLAWTSVLASIIVPRRISWLRGQAMAARRWYLGIVCCWAGCQPLQLFEEPKIATVSSNPFGLQAENRAAKISYQPADEALATRVDSVGRKLIAANPQIGLKSTLFATIGKAAQPEIFHVGPNMVYVTEGLVKRCPTDAELAGVLALELGKIVADREVAASPEMRNPERLAPIQVPIGNSVQ